MMASSRKVILNLYRNLVRESKKWNSYNYRQVKIIKLIIIDYNFAIGHTKINQTLIILKNC